MTKKQQLDINSMVAFFTRYTAMIEAQVTDVRADMEATVEELISSINKVYDSAEKIKYADEVLGVQPEAVSQSGAQQLPDGLDQHAIEAGKKLRAKMTEIQQVNSRLTNAMMDLMGLLSDDDVVRQQLEHVVTSMSCLKKSLERLLRDSKGNFSTKDVRRLADTVSKETFRSYTSQDEKEIFESVFGERVQHKRKSA